LQLDLEQRTDSPTGMINRGLFCFCDDISRPNDLNARNIQEM
jgi:hypothetical protein